MAEAKYKLVYVSSQQKFSEGDRRSFGCIQTESALGEQASTEDGWKKNRIHLYSIGLMEINSPQTNCGYSTVRFFPNRKQEIPEESLQILNASTLFPYIMLAISNLKIRSRIRSRS